MKTKPLLWVGLVGVLAALVLLPELLRRQRQPPPVLGQLPSFTLLDTEGRPYGDADLRGQVWVADFIFTRCQTICPILTAAMSRLDERYRRRDAAIRLVSVTVDPDYDTPNVLRAYGRRHGIDPRRWALLTGDREAIRRLVVGSFMLDLGEVEQTDTGLIEIAHSGKLVLVDGAGRIRGYFGTDETGLEQLYRRSLQIAREQRD
jgi:protein SCO1/2